MTALVHVLRPRLRAVIAAGVVLAALLLLSAPSSRATFRGASGLVLYQAQAGDNTQLFTIKPDGTGVTQLTHFEDSGASNANWAPDGQRFVFTRHWHPEGGPNERLVLYTANFDGTGSHPLPKAGHAVIEPNWLADGRRIIFLDYSTGTGRPMLTTATGAPTRAAGVSGSGGDSACSLPGNRIAFLRPKRATDDRVVAIFVAGLSGHGLKRITPWGGYADKIDCSPDGAKIVFSKPAFGQNGQSSNVFTVRTNGTGIAQLTHAKGGTVNDGADSWSPDGTKMAYVSNTSGTYQIWTMNADGANAHAAYARARSTPCCMGIASVRTASGTEGRSRGPVLANAP